MVNDENLQPEDTRERLDEQGTESAEGGDSLSIDFSNVQDDTETDTDKGSSDNDLNAVEAAEARYAIEEEAFEERRKEFQEADQVTRAELTDQRQFDRAVIRESYEKDQYIRDGNVLYPAPLERPAGATPGFVAEVVEFLGASNEEVRKAADEKAGLDPADRSDRDRLERALERRREAANA